MSRNAIKYQPFSALEGHRETLKQKEKEIFKETKPILSEDECIRINEILIEVINNDLECIIIVFKKDKTIKIQSKIKKVLNGYLYLEEDIVLITDIIDIQI
ncbi:MAG: YolD-like family protein [bacterium]